MKRVLFLFISVLFVSFISCKKEVKSDEWEDTLTSGLIRIACDENLKALMEAEIEVFEAHNPRATVIPIYTNEAEAIRLLTIDSVRFALVTRHLNSKEQAELAKKNMKAQKHLIAFDGIALIAHPSNQDSALTLADLKKILSGEIIRWTQINPKSTLDTIRVIFDHPESGILRYMMDSIMGGNTFSPNLYALNNSLEALETVSQRANALGLIGVNVLSDESDSIYRAGREKIRLVRLNNHLPYAGDIKQENYPLWRPVYVLLSDPKSGLASGLSIFLAHEAGQKIVLKSGLLPITDPQNISVYIKDEYPE
ncbi:MAG: substrate-binding domain-containing protein [Candidatus Symbiothrix sp.]|nr:substrate-binding domain-containing protein [Candidatus Symbiothrix sp.]